MIAIFFGKIWRKSWANYCIEMRCFAVLPARFEMRFFVILFQVRNAVFCNFVSGSKCGFWWQISFRIEMRLFERMRDLIKRKYKIYLNNNFLKFLGIQIAMYIKILHHILNHKFAFKMKQKNKKFAYKWIFSTIQILQLRKLEVYKNIA